MSTPPSWRSAASSRCGSGAGSPAGRANAVVRNGASASAVTTQGETVVAKFFARNGPSGCVFPGLDVARRPVVEQAKPKHVLACASDRNRHAQLRGRADVEAELELVIEIAGRLDRPARSRRRLCSGRAGRRTGVPLTRTDEGAAVIGDRHVFVVRHQRIVGPKHPSRVGGMKDRGEEIGEVADLDRHHQLGHRHRREVLFDLGAMRYLISREQP